MSLRFTLTLILVFFFLEIASPQSNGVITGRVVNQQTGEALIGANVLVEGTNYGAACDLDGKYLVKNIPTGEYSLLFSSIGFTKTRITKIRVTNDGFTTVNASLTPEAYKLDEVIVTEKASESYEAALLNQQKKSLTINDGISREQIKRSTDVTTADALKRISGITLIDNKFIFVRGVSERYSSAMLNNASLANTEPDKRSFAFDLIPSNLIDNAVVIKSFSPENPGDFAGALVKINTIDIPSKLTLGVSVSSSYVEMVTSRSFTSSQGGGKDYLGSDDGSRALPSNFPKDLSVFDTKPDTLYTIAKTLNNNWKNKSEKAPVNQSYSISYGDNYTLFGRPLGIVSSVSYRTNVTSSNILRRDLSKGDNFRFDLAGRQMTKSVFWGGIFNISYKLDDFHKLSIRNSYTVDADDEIVELEGQQYDKSADQISSSTRYVSRSLYSGQLLGEHYFAFLNGLHLNWIVASSSAKRNEPDYRRYTYVRDIGTDNKYYMNVSYDVNQQLGGRFFSDLSEHASYYAANGSMSFGTMKIKFGAAVNSKNRNFSSRLIGIVSSLSTSSQIIYQAIDTIFQPKNFRRSGFSIKEYINGTNNYTSEESVLGIYGIIEYPLNLFGSELKVLGGARVENSLLRLRTYDLTRFNPIRVDNLQSDILPSIGFIYQLNASSNLRLTYSKTLNRAEFREIAPFSYYDFQLQNMTSGNDSLKNAQVQNFDLRYEVFPGIGELFSVSLFYKIIEDAIERVVIVSSNGETRSFANAPYCKNVGFELETRFDLSPVWSLFRNLTLSANYTWVYSEIDETNVGIAKRKRPLQGQSPYVINIGLKYSIPDWDTDLSLQYNTNGERVVEVASYLADDITEVPRDVIDIVLTQGMGDHLEIKISAKDILSQKQIFKQKNFNVRENSRPASFSIGLSYNL